MTLDKPEFSREFRLGLVVYGGVSLAVYMNGVCREFYNAVRGRGIYKLIKALTDSDIVVDIISGTSAGGINGVLLSYALANSSEKMTFDFEDFAGVWRDSGDINQLLRKIHSNDEVNSLLDGEGYYQEQLEKAFWKVSGEKRQAPADDWFSDFNELDLFVTGTDVLGKVTRQFDNTGKLIEVNDHHGVFLLKHRRGRKEPFQPNNGPTIGALAKLCRITSCFPVAFPVVSVSIEESSELSIDSLLTRWGDLNNRVKPKEKPPGGYQLHFVDGGVLDNRPFSYTIEEIYYRHFYRPVARKLFYIDPSPDKFLDSADFKKMAKPNIWEAAADSLVGLPRYESIAGDLQQIARRNERVRRYKFLRSTATEVAIALVRSKIETGELQLPEARDFQAGASPTARGQISGDRVENIRQNETAIPTEEQIYFRCRLVGLRDRVLPLITGIRRSGDDNPDDNKKAILERAAELLTSYITDPRQRRERDEFLHKVGFQIRDLDVDYSIRKHFFILGEIVQAKQDIDSTGLYRELENLAHYLNRQLSLLEVVRFALDELLTGKRLQADFAALIDESISKTPEEMRVKIYGYLLSLHRFFLDADGLRDPLIGDNESGNNFFDRLIATLPATLDAQNVRDLGYDWLSSEQVSDILEQLKKRGIPLENIDTSRQDERNPLWQQKYRFGARTDRYDSILARVEAISYRLIRLLENSLADLPDSLQQNGKAIVDRLTYLFSGFDYVDRQIYPYEYLSDIQSNSAIDIARVSPEDATKGFGKGKPIEERLAGVQLRAFGGFFKKSWRSNDILWGRLDGLNRLVDCLLTPETVRRFPEFLRHWSENHPNGEIERFRDKLIEASLPNLTDSEKKIVVNFLDKLASDPGAAALYPDEFQTFLETLVLAGQRSVLKTDLENVLLDAVSEQFVWNQQLAVSYFDDLYDLGYRARKNPGRARAAGLREIEVLLDRLLEPKSRSDRSPVKAGDKCRQYIEELFTEPGERITKPKAKVVEALKALFDNAFPASADRDRQRIADRLYWLLQQLREHQIERFSETSKSFSLPYVLALDPFLELLLKISVAEENASSTPTDDKGELEAFNRQLKNVIRQVDRIKPTFSPIDGYLDKPLVPLVTGTLVTPSIEGIIDDPEKMENYFRYQYRVGTEKIRSDIPPIILDKLLVRTGLVIRNILRSEPTGKVLDESAIFQFVNRLLQTFYLWVEAKDPATSFVPKVLFPLVSWVGVALIALFTAYVVSQIPSLFLVIIITLLIAQLFYSAVGRKKWQKQLLKALAFLLIIGVLLSPLAGLPAWQDGKFVLKRLFNERCPLIQTRWTVKNCQKDSNGF